MNKFKKIKRYSLENNTSSEAVKIIKESQNNLDKVLCNHCGRTSSNGLGCLGICVADNEY